jgi:Flp pilus assembly protein TadG
MTQVHKQRLQSLWTDEHGSGLVEFAASASVLLMLIFGIMDASRALYADHYVSNIAREATRYAMVRGSSWGSVSCVTPATFSCVANATSVLNFVKANTPPGFSANNLIVNTSWPGTTVSGADCSAANANNSPGCVVTVQILYSFSFVLPFLPKNALVLSSTSSLSISQ